MPLVSQSISSFKGGVSQQPDIVRFADQVQEQINGFSSEVEGLQKRPPTIHVARLGDQINPKTLKYHVINRDDTEQYIMEMGNGSIRVWDLQGNPKTVKIKEDASYITSSNPQKDFRAVTVADYTFILNRTVSTKMTSDKSSKSGTDKALIYIKNANYAKSYAIFINGTFYCGMITPDGGEAKQAVQVTTSFIANRLVELFNGNYTNTGEVKWTTYNELLQNLGGRATAGYSRNPSASFSSYSASVSGDSTIVITSSRNYDMPDVDFRDGMGNTNAYAIKGAVNSTSKLPPTAPDGYPVKVQGETNEDEDDYWVRYNSSTNTWQESVAPDIEYKINASTMPHALIRQADGTFTFEKLTWADREVGDDDTNPVPSFIDRTINDIFFYRNRLGVISDENIILSGSSDFFNYWYKSAASIADTDPIDVAVSSNKVAILTNAIPYAKELMLFSREGQFVLSADGVLTPKSVKVDQITAFNYTDRAQPLSVGQSIFFINDRVDYCSLMRYYTVQDVADLKDAEDVTAHIPTYIPVGITRLSGNTTENLITITSETSPSTVWVYKYLIQDGASLQQSWSKWEFGYPENTQVCLAEFVNAYIYFLVNTEGGLFLEYTQLTGNAIDMEDEPYRLFIDRKIKYTVPAEAKYSDFNDETTISIKDVYGTMPHKDLYYFIDTDGYVTEISDWDDTTGNFTIRGDVRNKKYFVGRQYKFEVTLSQQSIKASSSDGATVSEDEGRLQLRYFWVNYSDSGVFDATVCNNLKNKCYTYRNTGKTLGIRKTRLGVNELYTGRFKFPIQDKNDEVVISLSSDNPTPINIISGGWEGFYVRRNTKV